MPYKQGGARVGGWPVSYHAGRSDTSLRARAATGRRTPDGRRACLRTAARARHPRRQNRRCRAGTSHDRLTRPAGPPLTSPSAPKRKARPGDALAGGQLALETAARPCCIVLCICVCQRCSVRIFRSCRRCREDVVLNVPHLESRRWPISASLEVLVLRLHLRLRLCAPRSKLDQREYVENCACEHATAPRSTDVARASSSAIAFWVPDGADNLYQMGHP